MKNIFSLLSCSIILPHVECDDVLPSHTNRHLNEATVVSRRRRRMPALVEYFSTHSFANIYMEISGSPFFRLVLVWKKKMASRAACARQKFDRKKIIPQGKIFMAISMAVDSAGKVY